MPERFGVSVFSQFVSPVSPATPVPEFNGTLIAFSLSLAALYCILEGRRVKYGRDFGSTAEISAST
jgi:hypothetical protein